MNKTYVVTGAIFICLGIILGAFGAHSLKGSLDSTELNALETGIRYQMYHGIALIIFGVSVNQIELKRTYFNGFLFGITLFSGSIYGLTLDTLIDKDFTFLGPLTPIGGAILILTWLFFILKTSLSK
ncbi:DUF423 domain-containing protein [Crocinitomicaceae bacterium]|nr:DUF423 domain-containing protein [Crocinitomicaceae bacterium]